MDIEFVLDRMTIGDIREMKEAIEEGNMLKTVDIMQKFTNVNLNTVTLDKWTTVVDNFISAMSVIGKDKDLDTSIWKL